MMQRVPFSHQFFQQRDFLRVFFAAGVPILRLQQGLKRAPLLGKPRFRKQDVDVIGGNRLARLDTPYVFVCPPENKKSSGTSSTSPRTRGSAALPFMRKISHPSLFFG